MKRQSFVRRYPEIPFVLLAYVLGAPAILLRFVDLPFEPLLIYASWTPNIAAFLVIGLILRQRGGIRRLVAGWGEWRVGVRWYLVAASPLFVAVLVAGVFIALGGAPADPQQPVALPLLMSLVLSVITGAMGEELGWRGFLLPRLQKRFNALTSSLIVGVVWALWHLPLWFLPGYGWDTIPYWAFALTAISSSVLFTFVLNNTGGSLLMASIIHFSLNFGMSAMGILGWLPSPSTGWVIASTLYALYAIAITVISGPARLSRSELVRPTPPGSPVAGQSGKPGSAARAGSCPAVVDRALGSDTRIT